MIGSCTTSRKCRVLPALRTWTVILPGVFQRYKMRCYLHPFRVAMASRRRPLAPTQPTVRAPELDSWTYVEVISPAFQPNRVLLRLIIILNDDKSKYVSVGFYPAQNYQPLVEFGGVKLLPYHTYIRLCRKHGWTAANSGGSYVLECTVSVQIRRQNRQNEYHRVIQCFQSYPR